jgi:hypothetical protein
MGWRGVTGRQRTLDENLRSLFPTLFGKGLYVFASRAKIEFRAAVANERVASFASHSRECGRERGLVIRGQKRESESATDGSARRARVLEVTFGSEVFLI